MTSTDVTNLFIAAGEPMKNLNKIHNDKSFLGVKDTKLERDLSVMQVYFNILTGFTVAGSHPADGNTNTLEAEDYVDIQNAFNKITGLTLNYDYE